MRCIKTKKNAKVNANSLVDECFNRQLVFQWVRIVLRYSPICFYMLMRQSSFKGFSRTKIEN